MDWTLVMTVILLLEGILILKAISELGNLIEIGLSDLDNNLGIAITQVVESLGGGSEPINPIQAALAQMLTQSIQPKGAGVIEVLQGDNGQFIKKD